MTASLRLLGVLGYLFTTDDDKRQALVPPGVEDDYLKKPATSSWRTRRRTAIPTLSANYPVYP
ncbi:hypothetical protein CALCODRAFT_489171 [Calocera cornea HHB12733]|uniref:Uncharacterized protein n=1 Tax=Calocera cornea HHB12733 TaxID=1353952 RepID=A0A166JFX1_9BASI|nr:hypothetical protein CALCODRAFT_489171 [Calocera cornea HHB12733]